MFAYWEVNSKNDFENYCKYIDEMLTTRNWEDVVWFMVYVFVKQTFFHDYKLCWVLFVAHTELSTCWVYRVGFRTLKKGNLN